LTLGYGGISEVCRACGLSRKAIAKGIQEIEDGTAPPPGRVRRPGAGRKKLVVHDPLLLDALERLVDPETRGDPESPLRWICKSTRNLKELLGNYDNTGQQRLPAKTPVKVNGHDFPSSDVPRAYPYGVYDVDRNTGFVNVGTNHDTGAFAVASIRGWWRAEGRKLYPKTRDLLITADGGGSNGFRLRLWKLGFSRRICGL
jgi:Rhodopirellula transposase.